MDSGNRFEIELNKLKENEDYIETFRIMFFQDINNSHKYISINKLLKFSKENNLPKSEAWGYYFLGWYNLDNSEYEESAKNFLNSYDLFESSNNKYDLAYACNGLTNIYCQMGQFKLAQEWGLKGISLCEEMSNQNAMIILLLNTGINYIQMRYYDKAKEIFESLIEFKNELTTIQRVSYMLSIAEIEINNGKPQEALDIISKALSIENIEHVDIDISEMFKLKAMAYIRLNKFDLAEEEFEKSYDFCCESKLFYEKCSTMLEWSRLQILLKKQNKAINLLNEVISICSQYKFNVILREAYYTLYLIHKEQNTAELALKFLEHYLVVDDEMYDYEQSQLMAKMNLKNTKRVAEHYKQLYNRTELLSTIGQKIISNLNINTIFNNISDEINKLLDADYFGIAIYDNEKDKSTYYFRKDSIEFTEIVKYSAENTYGEYCIKNKKDIIIGNETKEYKKFVNSHPKKIETPYDDSNISSIIYTPMIINDKVVGLMTVQSEKENLYSKDDLNILKILANYAAIAVENAILYKSVEDKAIFDNLTRFKTKTEILKLGDSIFENFKSDNKKYSIIMMDLDNFKIINDTYGHIYGDKALSLIAECISNCIRNTDYIGRFGGDEFLLICPGTSLKETMEIAERIRTTIERNIFMLGDGINVYLTLSLGVHECDNGDKSFTDAVKRADKCLYLAKGTKRNAVVNK